MKIRIYSPFLPFPVTEGAYRVIFDQAVSLMSLQHEVELVTWKDSQSSFQSKLHQWSQHGSLPLIRRLEFKEQNARWVRVISSFFSDAASPELFYYPKLQSHSLEDLGSCDLAIYHYSFAEHWLKRPHLLPQEKKRVVHFHNLESELFELRAQDAPRFVKGIHLRNADRLRNHEDHLVNLVDALWFLSPLDEKKWRSRQKAGLSDLTAEIKLIPPTYTSEIAKWTPWAPEMVDPRSKQVNLGFVGGMTFRPNQDSVRWILDKLVPELKKRGFQGRVFILGRGAHTYLQGQSLPPWIEVLPEHTEMKEFLAPLSWMLVPHVSGSGVRIKLLDALAQKIPVLATPEAVERLHPEIQESPFIFSSLSAEAWAHRICSESPFQSRIRLQDLSFPEAMRGDRVYQNV